MKDLSTSLEGYLETVLVCNAGEGHAYANDIAETLNVRMTSVTSAMITLAKRKLVQHERNIFFGPNVKLA